jgi:hypothetical protein
MLVVPTAEPTYPSGIASGLFILTKQRWNNAVVGSHHAYQCCCPDARSSTRQAHPGEADPRQDNPTATDSTQTVPRLIAPERRHANRRIGSLRRIGNHRHR